MKLDTGEHGSAVLDSGLEAAEGGAAVIRITPNPGYQIADIVVDGKAAQIPEDGILVIKDIRKPITVKITFRRQPAGAYSCGKRQLPIYHAGNGRQAEGGI